MQEYRYIAKKRIAYLRSTRSEPDQFTVLLSAIPKSSEKTYSQQVEDFFQTYYPDTYLKQSIVYADASWEKRVVWNYVFLISLRYHVMKVSMFAKISFYYSVQKEFIWLLNEVQFLRALPPTERIPEKNDRLGLFGKKEDPLHIYIHRLGVLYKDIRQTQKKFMQSKEVCCTYIYDRFLIHVYGHIVLFPCRRFLFPLCPSKHIGVQLWLRRLCKHQIL